MYTISTELLSTVTSPTNTTFVPYLGEVTKVKIGMAIGLLITVLIVTLVPYVVVKYMSKKWNLDPDSNSVAFRRFKLWMSRINCFAGGVFLSTGFMDILPEMLEAIEEAIKKNNLNISFPLGPFLTLVGFFMILILEESVTFCRTRCCFPSSLKKKNKLQINSTSQYETFQNEEDDEAVARTTSSNEENYSDQHNHEGHDHGIDDDALAKGNLAVTILMVAISVHSIFEGLALGLEKDTAGASRLFLALCLHKYVIALTIGLQISKSSLPLKMAIFCAIIFACATPIGVFVGFYVIYLEKSGDTKFSIVAGVLQAMACGTFFYIVFFEILPEEFSKRHDKWVKIFAVILGFILVSIVMYCVHE